MTAHSPTPPTPTQSTTTSVFEALFGAAAHRFALRLTVLWAALGGVATTATVVQTSVLGWCAAPGRPLVEWSISRVGVHATGVLVGLAVFAISAVAVTATRQVLGVREAARALRP